MRVSAFEVPQQCTALSVAAWRAEGRMPDAGSVTEVPARHRLNPCGNRPRGESLFAPVNRDGVDVTLHDLAVLQKEDTDAVPGFEPVAGEGVDSFVEAWLGHSKSRNCASTLSGLIVSMSFGLVIPRRDSVWIPSQPPPKVCQRMVTYSYLLCGTARVQSSPSLPFEFPYY